VSKFTIVAASAAAALVLLLLGAYRNAHLGPSAELVRYRNQIESALAGVPQSKPRPQAGPQADRTRHALVAREVANGPVWPPRRILRVPVEENTMALWDMFDIHGCTLSVLIGDRNGPLGRAQLPSQRYLYELRFLAAAPDCLTKLEGQRTDAERKLSRAVEQKRARLPAVRWNAIWGGDEMDGLLRVRQTHPPLKGQAARAVEALAHLVESDHSPEIVRSFEDRLQGLHHARGGGSVFALAREATSALRGVAAALAGVSDPSEACRTVELRRVFAGSYQATVQPLISALERESRLLGTALLRLFAVSRAGVHARPGPVSMYADATWDPQRGVAAQLREASRAHAQAWLNLCGEDIFSWEPQ